MARNKHPEETVSLILDTAFRLFMEKGYERTSIQDIIDHLGGLSKGAIYHHFKSKEDILAAVVDRMTAESNHMLEEIRDRTDLTGKEKLKTIFKESISRPVMDEMFMIVPNLHDNPRLLHSIFREAVELVAPQYILPIIRQGISDGSIQTDYPAELIILTANIWTNPLIFNNSVDECSRKFMVFRQMMQGLGLDIVDDEMADRIRELTVIYWNNKR